MRKARELRELTLEELHALLRELKDQLFDLRTKAALGQLDQNHLIRETKRDIARVLTVIREKELEREETS